MIKRGIGRPFVIIVTTPSREGFITSDALQGYRHQSIVIDPTFNQTLAPFDESADICILDVGNAFADIDTLQCIANAAQQVPMLVLLERNCPVDEQISSLIRHFSHGQLDVLISPLQPQELRGRITQCLRHSEEALPPLKLDTDDHCLVLDDHRAIKLTREEFGLVSALMSPPGRICSDDLLTEKLDRDGDSVSNGSVDQHINTLRAKLDAIGLPGTDIVRSIYGVGYQLRAIER